MKKEKKPGDMINKYQAKKKGRVINKSKAPKAIVKYVAIRGLV